MSHTARYGNFATKQQKLGNTVRMLYIMVMMILVKYKIGTVEEVLRFDKNGHLREAGISGLKLFLWSLVFLPLDASKTVMSFAEHAIKKDQFFRGAEVLARAVMKYELGILGKPLARSRRWNFASRCGLWRSTTHYRTVCPSKLSCVGCL